VESDPLGDKADEIACSGTANPIYQSPLESASNDDREVYMVGQGEQPVEKTRQRDRSGNRGSSRPCGPVGTSSSQKRHDGLQDDSRSSDDDARDGARSPGHHPKYNRRCPSGREWLQDQSQSIKEELGQNEYQGEQVFCTSAHNALTSWMIIDKLVPLLPKNNEEVNAQVKRLRAMLDAAIVEDPALVLGDKRRGQDHDHCLSPHRDSASSITPLEECGQNWDERDLHDVIHNRDALDWIENRCQERDRVEREWHEERD
jgi:hypothetical protein